MTFFDFIVPVIALAVAGVGFLVLRAQGRKLNDHHNKHHHHPAE